MTDKGNNDVFCEFHGDNHLTLYQGDDVPSCYFCCGMETCDSWDMPSTDIHRQCVQDLFDGKFSEHGVLRGRYIG